MTKTNTWVIFGLVLLAGGAVIRTLAAQDNTSQPGQPTQARVLVQNRGEAEALPVSIQNMTNEAPPLRVQVVGTATVVQSRGARQAWEYQDVTIRSGQSPAALLNVAGADGWEATGAAVPIQGGVLMVMKRPR